MKRVKPTEKDMSLRALRERAVRAKARWADWVEREKSMPGGPGIRRWALVYKAQATPPGLK